MGRSRLTAIQLVNKPCMFGIDSLFFPLFAQQRSAHGGFISPHVVGAGSEVCVEAVVYSLSSGSWHTLAPPMGSCLLVIVIVSSILGGDATFLNRKCS